MCNPEKFSEQSRSSTRSTSTFHRLCVEACLCLPSPKIDTDNCRQADLLLTLLLCTSYLVAPSPNPYSSMLKIDDVSQLQAKTFIDTILHKNNQEVPRQRVLV